MTETQFSALLALARDGDGSAFERLYQWLAPDVTRFATLRHAADASSVANKVLLRAFRQIGKFDGSQQSFRAWIFAIARNQLSDRIGSGFRPPGFGAGSGPAPTEADDVAGIEALDELSLQRVTRLLAKLSDDQRDVVLLRMVGELSVQQVSIVLDMPVAAVKVLQLAGLRQLQDEVLTEVISQ